MREGGREKGFEVASLPLFPPAPLSLPGRRPRVFGHGQPSMPPSTPMPLRQGREGRERERETEREREREREKRERERRRERISLIDTPSPLRQANRGEAREGERERDRQTEKREIDR